MIASAAAALEASWAVSPPDLRPKPSPLIRLKGLPAVLHHIDTLICQSSQLAKLLICHQVPSPVFHGIA